MEKEKLKRFMSWNVNGLRAIEKKGFVDIVSSLAPDILALQEMKATPDQLSDVIKNISGYHAYWAPAQRKGYAGVAVYTKEEPISVSVGMGVEEHDQEGRVLCLEYEDYYLVNGYFPNAQPDLVRLDFKLRFNRDILSFVNKLREKKSILICGDFNVAHTPIDLANPASNAGNPGFSPEERAWMDAFIAAGYTDTFRIFHKEGGQYTWWTYRFQARARNIGWRIDYFCIDQRSAKRVHNAMIHADIMGSDHCPVSVDFV